MTERWEEIRAESWREPEPGGMVELRMERQVDYLCKRVAELEKQLNAYRTLLRSVGTNLDIRHGQDQQRIAELEAILSGKTMHDAAAEERRAIVEFLRLNFGEVDESILDAIEQRGEASDE